MLKQMELQRQGVFGLDAHISATNSRARMGNSGTGGLANFSEALALVGFSVGS